MNRRVFVMIRLVVHGFVILSVRRPSSVRPSVFSFPDNNLCKYQWIFTKLGVYIDIIEIWYGIANGQFLSIFDRLIFPRHVRVFFYG